MRIQRFTACILILSILLCQILQPAAATNTDDMIRQLLQYYLHHQDNAETDILRLLEQLETIDPALAQDWKAILSAWSKVSKDLTIHCGVLPDGLPEDDSLCIVVMGFELNANGSMSEELLGRLDVALASAQKYPNAYILCAGGGTARGNYSVTEAGQMNQWLQEQGIASERIIIEDKSYSTELNVRYGMKILGESYPQIHSLAIVSSDYHIRRCHWLFQCEIILTDQEAQYQVVSNAAYEAGYPGESGYWFEAQSLANLLNLPLSRGYPPTLSKLTEITVTGTQTYYSGAALDLMVTAFYDSGYSRNITHKAEITGFDTSTLGDIPIEISYTENGQTKSTIFPVTILPPPTEVTEAETEFQPPAATETTVSPESVPATQTVKAETGSFADLWILCVLIAPVLLTLLVLSKKKRGKYQK